MNIYLGHAQTVFNRFNVESLADTTLNWLNTRKLLENLSRSSLSGLISESAIDSSIQVVSRIVFSYFIYPRVSTVAALINGSIGTIRLTLSLTEKFQATESVADAQEKWNMIARNIHNGLVHLITAGYDFGIGLLLKSHYSNFAGVIAFSTFPALALFVHQRVFKKSEETLADKVGPTTPSAKVTSTSLDTKCFVYVIAKRITLELMPPNQEPQENILKRVLKIMKRVSGIGGEKPLPDFGL